MSTPPAGGDPLAALPATLPIVLFPVRLEVRFVTDGTRRELRVRIFPEELHIDTHEPELTDEELRWGLAFRQRSAAADGEAQRAGAWTELADRFGAPRAGWIARTVEASPAPPLRAASWTRAPHTTLLPDRWLVVGRQPSGAEQFRVLGGPIPPLLAAGWNPRAEALDDDDAGVPTDEALRWLVDFDEAERVGMAVRVDLTGYTKTTLQQLVVVGVKVSAGDASELLERQFEALRHTTTLGFVPQGTPTNNTDTAATGYSTHDARHQAHFTLERLHGAAPAGSNAARVADALGAGRAAFDHAWGGHDDDQRGTGAMNRVLWPATWGYFLDHLVYATMLRPAGTPAATWQQRWSAGRRAAYGLFRDHVRARGPLPVLRVGNQPYGLLPIGDLNRWRPMNPAEADDDRVGQLLRRVRDIYFSSFNTSAVPRIGTGSHPERTLVDVLAQSPVPTSFGVQLLFSDTALDVLGELYKTWNVAPMLDETWNRLTGLLQQLGASIGPADRTARPFLGRAVFANDSYTFPSTGEFSLPVAQPDTLSPTEPLTVNYLDTIRSSTLSALRAGTPRQTLLCHLVRHAKLSAYLRAIEREQDPTRLSYREVTAAAIPSAVETCWDVAVRGYPQSSRTYLEQYDHLSATGTHTDPDLIDFDTGLDVLRSLPSQRLDLLARETLALTDDRLDAWTTAFATKRLTALRAAGHRGSYVGGYGWLVNVKVPPIAATSRVGEFDPTPDTVGYVHAPSADQAKTAALLRSGHQARAAENEHNPFDIDLSSERVRLARYLLDGVREGQPLGALLGYRFERLLHESGLAAHVPALRNAYPMVAGKQRQETAPADALAAPSVVDGVALVRAVRRHAGGGQHWMPLSALPTDVAVRAGLQRVGEAVERLLDAVDDAVTAESVFQALRGNHARAAAVLDAMAAGDAPPPELESQQVPRHGRTVSHRLLVLLPTAAPPSDRPRARAAPWLNAFSAAVLGDLGRYVLDGTYRRADGGVVGTRRINLGGVGLDPLDVVYLAATEPGGQSDLEALLRDHLLRERPDGAGPDTTVELRLDPVDVPAGQLDAATLVELARALYRLVAGSRPLTDADLQEVGEPATAPPATDLLDRAAAAVTAFTEAADALTTALSEAGASNVEASDVEASDVAVSDIGARADAAAAGSAAAQVGDQGGAAALRTALYAVSAFGVPGSVPRVPEDAPDAVTVLAEQASAVAQVLAGRLTELGTLADQGTADGAVRRLRLVFGAAFPALAPFVPTHAAELAAGFDSADTLLGSATDATDATEQFLSQVACVRPAAAALQRVRDYAEVLDPARALPLAAAQLPFAGAQTRWAALPDAPAGNGAVALLAARTTAAAHDPTQPLTGLLVDAWDEVVPTDTQTTGLAFNFDAPNSEPPNAILLATPADPSGHWSTDELLGSVEQLLRAVPARASEYSLPGFGHFLPATFLAYNPDNHTVSTDLAAHLR